MRTLKQNLRKEYNQILSSLSPEYKEQASREIVMQLKHLLSTLGRYSIGIYIPRENEPDILPLKGINSNYYFSLPRITPSNQLEFMAWEEQSQLTTNPTFGIQEISRGKVVSPQIFCIPGIAFSLQGDRLGNGAGHFDRYIARNKKLSGQKQIYIAICFHEGLTTKLACEQHDQKCDWIVTNKTIIKICS